MRQRRSPPDLGGREERRQERVDSVARYLSPGAARAEISGGGAGVQFRCSKLELFVSGRRDAPLWGRNYSRVPGAQLACHRCDNRRRNPKPRVEVLSPHGTTAGRTRAALVSASWPNRWAPETPRGNSEPRAKTNSRTPPRLPASRLTINEPTLLGSTSIHHRKGKFTAFRALLIPFAWK